MNAQHHSGEPAAAQHFLDFADSQIPAPLMARHRAAEKRAELARRKALQERDHLLRRWLHWRGERLAQLLAGPQGDAVRDLVGFLDGMTFEQAPALVEFIATSQLRIADADTRFEILHLIDRAIASLREKQGLPPFDDALPGEAPTAFQIIRGLLS
jgi:hypothetical protein